MCCAHAVRVLDYEAMTVFFSIPELKFPIWEFARSWFVKNVWNFLDDFLRMFLKYLRILGTKKWYCRKRAKWWFISGLFSAQTIIWGRQEKTLSHGPRTGGLLYRRPTVQKISGGNAAQNWAPWCVDTLSTPLLHSVRNVTGLPFTTFQTGQFSRNDWKPMKTHSKQASNDPKTVWKSLKLDKPRE